MKLKMILATITLFAAIQFIWLFAIVGCSGHHDLPQAIDTPIANHSNEVDSQPLAKATRLWFDEDAASMIEAVTALSTGDHVFVIRWENGAVGGQASLESIDDSKPVTFDLSALPKSSDAGDIEVLSGWVVATLRRLQEKEGEVYDTRIELQFKVGNENTSVVYKRDSIQGILVRVPPGADQNSLDTMTLSQDTHSNGRSRVALMKSADGKSTPWLELSLGQNFDGEDLLSSERSAEQDPK